MKTRLRRNPAMREYMVHGSQPGDRFCQAADPNPRETIMCTSKMRHWLLAAICLPLCGCIGGEVVSYTRYDKAADSFARLDVYVNIETDTADELDHIAKLYKRRDRLVINVVPEFTLFSLPVLLERHGKHHYSEWPVGSAVKEEPERRTTAIDLNSIKVIPGEFFLNEYGNLCYYHQAVIPGRAVDAAMRERIPQIAAELARLAKEQRQLAAKMNSRKLSWNQVRQYIRESLEQDAANGDDKQQDGQGLLPLDSTLFCMATETSAEGLAPDAHAANVASLPTPFPREHNVRRPKREAREEDGQELLPLDATSLRLLARTADDNLVQFTREADVFRLLVPLSEYDCREAVQTVELARKVIADRQKAGKPVERELVDILKVVELRHVEGSGLRVTVHGTAFWKLAARRQESMPKPHPDKKATYHSTVAEIRSRGIEVNETDLFPTILRRFFETVERP
jgi:hypothetical protein